MLPTYESLGKKAIIRLFNTIMMRAGVTLVITTAFSISTMFYNISATYPFFMVAFLQIVTFAGIYFKLGDIMSMFNLQSNDSQSMGRRVMRRPQMLMNRKLRQLNRNVGRTLAFGGGAVVGNKLSKDQQKSRLYSSGFSPRKNPSLPNNNEASPDPTKENPISKNKKQSRMNLAGRKIGKVLDTQALVKDKSKQVKDQVRSTPTNLKYNLHKGIEKTKKAPEEFKRGLVQEKANRAELLEKQRQCRDEKMAEKRKVLNETGNRHGKRRGNVPIKTELQPQKDRAPKREAPKRIVRANPNPEIKRKLTSQENVSKRISQPSSKKNSFQQVKQRSTLPKQTNQKVQKRMNSRPKSRSGEKK
ncbi:membrane protein [Enterococcus malodoratus]|nr:membrane protein [Enterococcus malodoratus]